MTLVRVLMQPIQNHAQKEYYVTEGSEYATGNRQCRKAIDSNNVVCILFLFLSRPVS